MRFMKTLSAIITGLQAIKGEGRWKSISKASGVHYDTVARIARGDLKAPSVLICERISDALDADRRLPAKQEG
jgi:hypothetical protein